MMRVTHSISLAVHSMKSLRSRSCFSVLEARYRSSSILFSWRTVSVLRCGLRLCMTLNSTAGKMPATDCPMLRQSPPPRRPPPPPAAIVGSRQFISSTASSWSFGSMWISQ